MVAGWERQVPGRSHEELTLKLCCEGKKKDEGQKVKKSTKGQPELFSEHVQLGSVKYCPTGKDPQIIPSVEETPLVSVISTDFPCSEN